MTISCGVCGPSSGAVEPSLESFITAFSDRAATAYILSAEAGPVATVDVYKLDLRYSGGVREDEYQWCKAHAQPCGAQGREI